VGGTNWFSCHFYDGTRRGLATLAFRPLRWNADGWPETGPLDKMIVDRRNRMPLDK
jgi:hypothetical protein